MIRPFSLDELSEQIGKKIINHTKEPHEILAFVIAKGAIYVRFASGIEITLRHLTIFFTFLDGSSFGIDVQEDARSD
ncbi:MAG: hypothetical protein HQM10_26605 [Candidatus Riflebacteria bacterium]|nr:hypothetical protein [Candidatus Riflebacteria bacterium]